MALTLENIKTRLEALSKHADTPEDTKLFLDDILERDENIGRDVSVVMAKIDAALDRPATQQAKDQIAKMVSWIRANLEDIPES